MSGPTPPGITVTGGAAGTRACTEALVAIAGRLERAADHLEDAAAALGEVTRSARDTATLSPATAAQLAAEAVPLRSRWGGLRARADAARVTACDLRTAAQVYARAELDASAALRAAVAVTGAAIGEQGPVAALVALQAAVLGGSVAGLGLLQIRLLRSTPTPAGLMLRWVSQDRFRDLDGPAGFVARSLGGPGTLPNDVGLPHADSVRIGVLGLAAMLRALLPGRQPFTLDPVPDAAGLIRIGGRAATMLGGTPMPGLVVAPVVGHGPQKRVTAPCDTADLLRDVNDLYSATPGTVGVRSLDHADGTRSWVVTIPGTQSMSLTDGPVPTDMASNLDMVAGRTSAMSEVVIQSMLQAGVGPNEAVALAGHSQGGLTAMQVAADPRVVAGFSVAVVVTAGSPVAGMSLPAGVQALHLEHVQDFVPALDGAANPAVGNRTTVVRDLAAGGKPDRAAALSIEGSHELSAYVRTAELADGGHPSVQRFDEALASVLGDGTAEVADRRFVGARTSVP